jgi:hypothetical protein
MEPIPSRWIGKKPVVDFPTVNAGRPQRPQYFKEVFMRRLLPLGALAAVTLGAAVLSAAPASAMPNAAPALTESPIVDIASSTWGSRARGEYRPMRPPGYGYGYGYRRHWGPGWRRPWGWRHRWHRRYYSY